MWPKEIGLQWSLFHVKEELWKSPEVYLRQDEKAVDDEPEDEEKADFFQRELHRRLPCLSFAFSPAKGTGGILMNHDTKHPLSSRRTHTFLHWKVSTSGCWFCFSSWLFVLCWWRMLQSIPQGETDTSLWITPLWDITKSGCHGNKKQTTLPLSRQANKQKNVNSAKISKSSLLIEYWSPFTYHPVIKTHLLTLKVHYNHNNPGVWRAQKYNPSPLLIY